MKLSQRLKTAINIVRNKNPVVGVDFFDMLGISSIKDEEVKSEATYYACLKVLSESVGKLPLNVMRYDDKQGVIKARDHPLYKILHDRPNPYMSASTFWSTVERNKHHYGNAYVLITGFGVNTRLWIMPSNEIELWYDDKLILADIPEMYYIWWHGGKRYVFTHDQVLHFKSSHTKDGVKGIAVKDQLASTIQGNVKAQKMLNKMYDSGFTAKAVLQYTGELSKENVEKFTRGIERFAKGELKEKGIENIIPIPLGTTLQPLNVKLADNQFIDVKQYSSLQIASAFGIKPYQIGDYTKSSYASAEAQQLSFYVDTLLFNLKQNEEEINYKLLSTFEGWGQCEVKFNVATILRTDLKTQIETLSLAVNSFLYTPNEARAFLDKPSVEGGDRLLGNGASIPVEYTGMQYTEQNKQEEPKEGEENE